MSEINEFYTFYFKIAYTERTFYFSFNPDITIKKFIESVKNDFDYYEPNRNIEIVEGDQYNNINGREPELAPKINYHDEYTLRDVYGHRWRNTMFYIRLIPIPQSSEIP
jgi:hypothetical protein